MHSRLNSYPTCLGFILISPALKILSLMPSAATPCSVLASSHQSVSLTLSPHTLLDHLPESLKTAGIVHVFTPPHTQKVAQQVQAWRHPTNPIDVHSFTHFHPPPPNTDFVLAMPRAEDAPRIAARLLATLIPFALLLPSDLALRIADANQFPEQPDLQLHYKQAGKIMFLDSDHLWILGNMPSLSDFSKIFSLILD